MVRIITNPKNCPCCKKEPTVLKVSSDDFFYDERFVVLCLNEECTMPTRFIAFSTIFKAVEAWNNAVDAWRGEHKNGKAEV